MKAETYTSQPLVTSVITTGTYVEEPKINSDKKKLGIKVNSSERGILRNRGNTGIIDESFFKGKNGIFGFTFKK